MAAAEPNPKRAQSAKSKSIGETVNDLVELLKTYAKQETVEPLKRLGRYLGFGVGGSVLITTGLVFLMLALAPGAADRDRLHVHRQLVVGAVLDRGRGHGRRRRHLPQLHQALEGEVGHERDRNGVADHAEPTSSPSSASSRAARRVGPTPPRRPE